MATRQMQDVGDVEVTDAGNGKSDIALPNAGSVITVRVPTDQLDALLAAGPTSLVPFLTAMS